MPKTLLNRARESVLSNPSNSRTTMAGLTISNRPVAASRIAATASIFFIASSLSPLHGLFYVAFGLLHHLARHLLDQLTAVLFADGPELLLLLLVEKRSDLGIHVVCDFLQLLQ